MSGEVWTQVYDRLAELIREHRTTHRLRQYPAPGRTRGAASLGADRRGACRRPPRQSRQGPAARRRAAAEARRAEGAGGDRLARARHRHRRCGSGLPDRLHPLDQRLSAARGARGTLGRRHLQGQAVSAVARRAGGVRRAARCRAARRVGPPRRAAECARRADSTDCRRGVLAGVAGRRAVRARARRVLLSRFAARRIRRVRRACWRKASARAAAATAR